MGKTPIAVLGIDLGKNSCSIAGLDAAGAVVLRRRMTREGLVMASDSRTNAGFDDLNIARKMHTFIHPGERVFVALTSGSLSLSQSVINLVREGFDSGQGLAQAKSMYEAAREVGEVIRQV